MCNVSGMRRAFAGLRSKPGYVLTDGFPVHGLGVPGLAVWKGNRVTASVAAASVLAKVSRDRMMRACMNVIPYTASTGIRDTSPMSTSPPWLNTAEPGARYSS